MPRSRLSSKGQLIIPKAVRDRHGWRAGTELEVEDRGDVVLLRPAEPLFAPTTLDQVVGCLRYEGPLIPAGHWNDGIDAMMRAMWEDFERQAR